MKKFTFLMLMLISFNAISQTESSTQLFWNNLQNLCGKTFEGKVVEAPENDSFRGHKLVMHVRSCNENTIKIPFFVGDDKSRTWVLTYQNDRIQLKHDHRHEDGSPDKVTQYGGIASNEGFPNLQMFPADKETADLISYASTNIWWITIDAISFTYNLRRIGTDRFFSISFDLTKPIAAPDAPWGWKD